MEEYSNQCIGGHVGTLAALLRTDTRLWTTLAPGVELEPELIHWHCALIRRQDLHLRCFLQFLTKKSIQFNRKLGPLNN